MVPVFRDINFQNIIYAYKDVKLEMNENSNESVHFVETNYCDGMMFKDI